MTENVNYLAPVSELSIDERSTFIWRCYAHVVGAIVAFALVSIYLFQSGISAAIAGPMINNWWMVLGAFMLGGWGAAHVAHRVKSVQAQYAALAAFSDATMKILNQRRQEYQDRRDFLLPQLRKLGFQIPIDPQGAFYIYADASRFTSDSYNFVYQLLESAGVAVTPGIDFGQYRASQHIRLAYTRPIEVLDEGVMRMAEFLKNC